MHYIGKKTNYTAPGAYRDLDGNMRQFTYINHDPKTGFHLPQTSTFNQQWEFMEKVVETLDKEIVEGFLLSLGKKMEDLNFGQLKELAKNTKDENTLRILEGI